jgi:hypothetical protein
MGFDIKWNKDDSGVYTTECTTISVYELDGGFVVEDLIEDEKHHHKALVDVMDDGGKRYLTTKMGQFSPFIKSMEKTGDLEMNHLIV